MFSSIIFFFTLLLILCGLFFVFYLLMIKLFSEDCDNFYMVVEGFEENEQLTRDVCFALSQVNMMNFGKKRPVYIIDRNLTEKKKALLKKEFEDHGSVVFLKEEALQELKSLQS